MRRKTAAAYDFRIRHIVFGNALGNSIVGAIQTTSAETQQQANQSQSQATPGINPNSGLPYDTVAPSTPPDYSGRTPQVVATYQAGGSNPQEPIDPATTLASNGSNNSGILANDSSYDGAGIQLKGPLFASYENQAAGQFAVEDYQANAALNQIQARDISDISSLALGNSQGIISGDFLASYKAGGTNDGLLAASGITSQGYPVDSLSDQDLSSIGTGAKQLGIGFGKGLGLGLAELPLEVSDVLTAGRNYLTGSQYQMNSILGQYAEQGGTTGDLLLEVGKNVASILPPIGIFRAAFDGTQAALNGDVEGIGSGLAGLAGSFSLAKASGFGETNSVAGPVINGEGAYGDLVGTLDNGFQAHHLNQNAVFSSVIPKNDGFAIGIQGNAFTDVGTPHYDFHNSMEGFFNQYRVGGDLFGEVPTNAQYGDAVTQALQESGFNAAQAQRLSDLATQNRTAFGLLPDNPIPRIPGRIYQSGGG